MSARAQHAAFLALALPIIAGAADYRATSDPATILYDAPSARAKPLYVYGRDVPVEMLVNVEGWTKIRDAGGTIGWMQSGSLADKRMVVVRAPGADVRMAADDTAPRRVSRRSGRAPRNRGTGGVAGRNDNAGLVESPASRRTGGVSSGIAQVFGF